LVSSPTSRFEALSGYIYAPKALGATEGLSQEGVQVGAGRSRDILARLKPSTRVMG
jgi:hypothetical protein